MKSFRNIAFACIAACVLIGVSLIWVDVDWREYIGKTFWSCVVIGVGSFAAMAAVGMSEKTKRDEELKP